MDQLTLSAAAIPLIDILLYVLWLGIRIRQARKGECNCFYLWRGL